MRKTFLVIFNLICFIQITHSQNFNLDSLHGFGFHLGVNYGGGIAGGDTRGGLLKISPRFGLSFYDRFIIGIESNSDYQVIYLKNSPIEPSIRLIKWYGPFARYYFPLPNKKWNFHLSANYIKGSVFVSSVEEKYQKSFNTFFAGLGMSYKINKTFIEAGYRYTFLFNNTPNIVRWTNSMYLGITWNF